MITDDELDRYLTEAGDRWRNVHERSAAVRAQPPRNHRWPAVAAAVVAALAIALPIGLSRGGGGTSPAGGGAAATALTGTTWQLINANGHVNRDRSVVLTISGGQLNFYDGVNEGSGPVRVTDHELHIGALSVGAVGGTGASPIPGALGDVLAGTAHWSIAGQVLTITKDGERLMYEVQPNPSDVLDGRTWRLAAVSDGAAVHVVVQVSISFTGDTYGLDELCEKYSGTVVSSADSLHLSTPHLREQCSYPDIPGMDAEIAAVDRVVGGTANWTIDNQGRLVLDRGNTTLVLTAA